MITNYALTSSLAAQRQSQVRATAARHSRLHGTDEPQTDAPSRSRRTWARVLMPRTQARAS